MHAPDLGQCPKCGRTADNRQIAGCPFVNPKRAGCPYFKAENNPQGALPPRPPGAD